MKAKLFSSSILLVLISLFLTQCSKHHERFEYPPWLGGTNIETLEETENYSIFLELMELADYRTSIENQLFTLFVPSDSAFEVYFQEAGISSIDDISVRDAEEIFGLHILINPRSRDQLMYEYAWGELENSRGEYGTLFHRKSTYSKPQDYSDEVRYFEELLDETVLINRLNVMIPLWTTEYFEDCGGTTDGSDYLFMYPNSSWSGTQWHDAMVTDGEVRTSSGFIYYLDRVVAPPPTIETYLKDNQDEFGVFYDIAQRYAVYTTAGLNENKERHYNKTYNQVLNFSSNSRSGPPANQLYMWSAVVPNDDALNKFLDEKVLTGVNTIDSLPELFKVYLLNSCLHDQLVLPSKLENNYQNYFGDHLDVDLNTDVYKSFMTCNGPVYALNRFLEPLAFSCVPGPLFYDKQYSDFLYTLQNSDLLSSLIKQDINMTLFAMSNEELLDYGIRTRFVNNNVIIQIRGSDGVTWKTIREEDLEDFVKDHIYYGSLEDFSGEGYIRMASNNYIYYSGGEIYGGGNQVDDDPLSIIETRPSDLNGYLYISDNVIQKPLNLAQYLYNDPELSSFGELLQIAGMIDSIQDPYELTGVLYPKANGLTALEEWTFFAPTNQAIADAKALSLIPIDTLDGDADTLRRFIQYHFVRDEAIFDDGIFSGIAETQRSDTATSTGPVYQTLDITNSVYNLVVDDNSGQSITIEHEDANKLVEYGVLHKINSVLLKD